MRDVLQAGLSPTRLEITDESALHAGHGAMGHKASGEDVESHFRVVIEAAAFAGLRPLARHRMVNALLKSALETDIHALSLKLLAPGES